MLMTARRERRVDLPSTPFQQMAGTSHSIWKYWIGGERVQPQSDDFYRGLSWIVCPFNAAPEPSLGNSIYGVP
jgi:hypothetical protein